MSTIKLSRSELEEKKENESVSQNSESINQPIDQPNDKARGPVELILPCGWRDCIINSLNQFSSLLFLETISDDLRKKALEKANDLVTRLICLATNDSQPDDDQRPTKKMRVSESGESKASQRLFEISFQLRRELIDQLNCNLSPILDSDGDITSETRNRIANQNARLNIQLLSLPFKTRNAAADESNPFKDELQNSKAVNFTIRKLRSKIQISPNFSINNSLFVNLTWTGLEVALRDEISRLQEEVRRLEAIVEKLDPSNFEATFNFDLPNVSTFFLSNGENVPLNRDFVCRDLPWRIQLATKTFEEDGKRVQMIVLRLRCEHKCVQNWSIKIYGDLMMPGSDKVWTHHDFFHTFTKAKPSG